MKTITLSPGDTALLEEVVRYLGGTNHKLVDRIESPDGKNVATLVSFMTNCLVVGLHVTGRHPTGPWVSVDQLIWSADSQHFAFVALFLSDPEEEFEEPAYCVYIDGHKVASYTHAPTALEFTTSNTLTVTVDGEPKTLLAA